MSHDKKYNGWANYETWNVALWIDNEQGTYSMRTEWAEESWNDAVIQHDEHDERLQEATRTLADKIKDFVDENNPLAREASMYSDLLGAALSEVDYYEIAENWLEDVEKEEEEETEDAER